MIRKTTTIEEIIEQVPGAISYLMEQNIRCIRCGEPIWGTLEEAARGKGYQDMHIEIFVDGLNKLLAAENHA